MAIENRNLPVRDSPRGQLQEDALRLHGRGGRGGRHGRLRPGGRLPHKSPSAAGSKVMGGKAVNGWRFWTVEGEAPAAPAEAEKPAKTRSRSKGKKKEKVVFKTPPGQHAGGQGHYFCCACMKGFDVDGRRGAGGLPRRPPQRRPGAQRAVRRHRRRRGRGERVSLKALEQRKQGPARKKRRPITDQNFVAWIRRTDPRQPGAL